MNNFVLQYIPNIIHQQCKCNKNLPETVAKDFFYATVPRITFSKFMSRLFKYMQCSPECFVLAFIYIDRISPKLYFHTHNCHKLFFVSLVLAIKMQDDDCLGNVYYSKVGGMDIEELNFLESKLFFILGGNLVVLPETYYMYLRKKPKNKNMSDLKIPHISKVTPTNMSFGHNLQYINEHWNLLITIRENESKSYNNEHKAKFLRDAISLLDICSSDGLDSIAIDFKNVLFGIDFEIINEHCEDTLIYQEFEKTDAMLQIGDTTYIGTLNLNVIMEPLNRDLNITFEFAEKPKYIGEITAENIILVAKENDKC